jgi:hypothetical protein
MRAPLASRADKMNGRAHSRAMLLTFLAAALAGPAVPADSPGLFVDRLYAYYATSDPGPREDADVYTPEIVDLYARLEARAGPDEVVREGDDICLCQDWENLRLISRTVHQMPGGRIEVDVRFENFGQPYETHLVLAHTPAGWRVADIPDIFDGQSLTAYLRSQIGEAR